MSDFAAQFAATRRLSILRRLVELGGTANEAVIVSVARQDGFRLASRDDVRADLDHLAQHDLIDIEHFDTLRIAHLKERGEDCAYGRVMVDGVDHGLWHRR